MKNLNVYLALLVSLAFINSANAAFPDDLTGDDVVFIEGASGERVATFEQTGTLSVSVTEEPVNVFGRQINLIYDKAFVWPADNNGVNGNTWGFVKVGDIWYGGTWEYIGFGRTDRSEGSFVGPKHFRFPPLQNFRPVDGEVYGFMITPVVRNNTRPSVRERTNIAFYRWGEGPVEASEIFGGGGGTSALLPSVDLILDDLPASTSMMPSSTAGDQ